jgi:type IV secretion system protein TrbJ
LQIRSLLVAQQTAEAARLSAELDADARGDVRAKQMRTWNFRASPEDQF